MNARWPTKWNDSIAYLVHCTKCTWQQGNFITRHSMAFYGCTCTHTSCIMYASSQTAHLIINSTLYKAARPPLTLSTCEQHHPVNCSFLFQLTAQFHDYPIEDETAVWPSQGCRVFQPAARWPFLPKTSSIPVIMEDVFYMRGDPR